MRRFDSGHPASACPGVLLGALAVIAAPGSALAADTGFSLAVGAEYTSGEYGGEESVDEVYVPVTGRYETQRLSFRLTVPFLSVRAPEGTYTEGPDGQPIIGEGPTVTESGIGDVLASVTVYDVFASGSGDVALDLTGKVKLGTADVDKGLGTGEPDFTAQADLFRFFDRFTAIGTLGYTMRGDPDAVDLENALFASLGGTYAVAPGTRLGLFYDFREASLPGSDDIQELSATLSQRMSEDWRVHGYLIAGFSDSSPDWGAGVSLSYAF
jgi:hypothetical protein